MCIEHYLEQVKTVILQYMFIKYLNTDSKLF